MFGLEKKPGEKFAFDLEKEVKERPAHGKEILGKAEKRAQELKKLLREGHNEKEFETIGLLLHGYTALQKVLRKIGK